jgi:putative acetyltransferase
MTSLIRLAGADDSPRILDVTSAAFRGNGVSGDDEVAIVLYVWDNDCAVAGLELVAEVDGVVVGHVLCSTATVGDRDVVAVAPLSVLPEHQRRGVGSALMTALIERADGAGHALLGLLGSRAYYPRFGFEPGHALGITYAGVPPESPSFQVRRLTAYDPSYRGAFTYCWGDDPKGPGH